MNSNKLQFYVVFVLVLTLLISSIIFPVNISAEDSLPLIIELKSEDIIEVSDGDTIKIKPIHKLLPVKQPKNNDDYVPIRLAGINCNEKRDQTSWLGAKEFTEEYFGLNNEDIETGEKEPVKIEYTYQIEFIGTGDYDRALAFIRREIVSIDDETENDNKDELVSENEIQDLGLLLIENGLAIPAISNFITEDEYKPYIELGLDYIESAISCYDNPPESDSVWSSERLDERISVEITPCIKVDKDDENEEIPLTDGNIISVNWTDNKKNDYLNLAGYSFMDENASADHRFFLPDIIIGMHTTEINIWFSEPNNDIDDWIVKNDDGTFDLYALIGNLITLSPKSKGESIFLRDPNRKIIDWVYWNGEETVTPNLILEHLTKLKGE